MKKSLITLLAVFVIITAFVAGCGGSSPEPKKEKPAAPVKICTVAGIGDTIDEWIKDHGKPNRDNGLVKNFKNDDLLVAIPDKRAWNITIQAEDLNDADKYVKNMVPKDGKFISEKTTKDGMVTTVEKEYTSETLKLVVKSNLTGHYSVSELKDSKTNRHISYVIDCTPSLQEIQKAKEAK